jgi:hypothetical protein
MSQQLWQGKKIQVCSDWYSPCIRSSVWLKSLPEDLYVELLCFITVNWKKRPTQMQNENLLRYITSSGSRGVASASNAAERTNTGLASVSNVADGIRIYLSS